ncbi:MAG: hypothetical protein ACRCYY_08890 [Trueperaceae bacterium]
MFSRITEAVILFSLSAPFWHLLWVSRQAAHKLSGTLLISITMLLWTTYAYVAVRYGADLVILGDFSPARPLLYLLLAAITAWSLRGYLLGKGVSQHLLIGFQLIRPIGMVFVLETFRGTLPGVFAHPAGWGDLLVGIVAIVILFRYWHRSVPTSAVLFVNILGLLDFASAFFFGFTSSATPVQLFSFDFPNRVIDYPTGLIPLFLVPYAVVAHILSLEQLAKE